MLSLDFSLNRAFGYKKRVAVVNMETQTQVPTHPFPSTMDPSQKFYRHFQDNVAGEFQFPYSLYTVYRLFMLIIKVLNDQIKALKSTSNIGGERQAAHDHILAGISKLQNEVADAAEYTPPYDRRQYSQVCLMSRTFSYIS